MNHALNFYAGPSVLPHGSTGRVFSQKWSTIKEPGLSLVETSHRSPEYDEVHMGAINLMRELFSVPDNLQDPLSSAAGQPCSSP